MPKSQRFDVPVVVDVFSRLWVQNYEWKIRRDNCNRPILLHRTDFLRKPFHGSPLAFLPSSNVRLYRYMFPNPEVTYNPFHNTVNAPITAQTNFDIFLGCIWG